MSIEEKAKAYDEALEQAKKELNTCGSLDCDAARQMFRLFPELREKPLTPFQQCLSHILYKVYYASAPGKVDKFILDIIKNRTDELVELAKRQEKTDCQLRDSEDERIYNEIMEFFKMNEKRCIVDNSYTRWIAWLEKQKEQNEESSKPELKTPEWVCRGWDDEYMINTVIGRYSLHAEVAKKRGDTHDYNLSKSMENWLRNVVKPLILEKQKEEKPATIEQVYEKFLSSDTLKSAKENKYIRAQVFWELMHNGIITEVDYQYLTDDKRKPWTAEEYRIAYQKGFEMSEQLKQKEQSLRDFIDDFPYSDEQKEQKPITESKRLANEVIEYLTKCGYSPVLKDDSKKEHFHIDIPRHKDDFWHSEEYKHCRSVLGEYYMEGDYGGDTYTLYVWREKKDQKPAEWKDLTWKDIVELEGIINNVHYEFRNGIGQESFGKEVLEKFREYKGDEYLDEKEQKPDRCKGCNNVKGCVTCVDGSEWAYIYEEQKPVKLNDDAEVGLDRALRIVKAAKGNLYGYQSDDGIYECDHAIRTLERILKNGIEQKPVEYLPKQKVFDIMNKLTNLSYSERIPIDSEEYVKIHEITSDVNSLLDYPIKPVEWSEEDNIGWDEAFACVTRAEKSAKNEEELQNAVTAEKWLKEIKFKYYVHPIKQEWSEEDEEMRSEAIRVLVSGCERYRKESGCLPSWHKVIDWLKSLRPQWKPNEEDIKMLEHIIGQYETGNKNSKVMGYLPRVEELNFLKKVLTKWKNSIN